MSKQAKRDRKIIDRLTARNLEMYLENKEMVKVLVQQRGQIRQLLKEKTV